MRRLRIGVGLAVLVLGCAEPDARSVAKAGLLDLDSGRFETAAVKLRGVFEDSRAQDDVRLAAGIGYCAALARIDDSPCVSEFERLRQELVVGPAECEPVVSALLDVQRIEEASELLSTALDEDPESKVLDHLKSRLVEERDALQASTDLTPEERAVLEELKKNPYL